jgi:alpha-aminoadipate/glutamate carrier protein LysW
MVASDVAFAATQPHGARMATCPECEYDEIDTEDFEEGDSLSCPECGKNLVLLGNDELDFADEDDDLDDDEDEDEDEVGEDEEDEDDVDDEDDEELDE